MFIWYKVLVIMSYILGIMDFFYDDKSSCKVRIEVSIRWLEVK